METALISLLGVALAGLLGLVRYEFGQLNGRLDRLEASLGGRMDRLEERLDRVEQRLGSLEVTVGRIGERLDAHVTDHPPAGRRVV